MLLSLLGAAPAHASTSATITGTVTAQGGGGVSGVAVTATAAGQTAVQFGPVDTAADGSFELGVVTGAYDIHFTPAGGLNPIVYTNVAVTANTTLNVVLTQSSAHAMSGVVRDAAGAPVAGLTVDVHAVDQSGRGGAARTDAAGRFSVSVPPLVYGVQIRAADDSWALYSEPRTFDLTAADVVQDFQLPPFVTLTVTVKDAGGGPISGAAASIRSGQQPGFTVAPGLTFLAAAGPSKQTDGNGQAAFSVFSGFNLTAGQVCATFA
ncbi:carboxypeptidase regulatory-like domain-containing protein, partial [Dactylosporangium sp. NPDC049140]|uniref:carboxypeptidase regulatory-like domain-containing protein n=1 Tax=Dactylosporangium sp. NPDC049140 TaxID=3155647 RepID=UPI0033C27CC2